MTIFDFLEKHYLDLATVVIVLLVVHVWKTIWSLK